jgi:hypothetical protein
MVFIYVLNLKDGWNSRRRNCVLVVYSRVQLSSVSLDSEEGSVQRKKRDNSVLPRRERETERDRGSCVNWRELLKWGVGFSEFTRGVRRERERGRVYRRCIKK